MAAPSDESSSSVELVEPCAVDNAEPDGLGAVTSSAELAELRAAAVSTAARVGPAGLNVEALKKWIDCFCVVNFDLELGQTLEATYPNTYFGDTERTAISFLSFPDSNSKMGSTHFTFRFRREDGSFSYGYSCFFQEKDASIHRGYMQKSLVIISSLPYVALFRKVVSIVGHMFCEFGPALLEAACNNVSLWPEPQPGLRAELPVLGTVITTQIPLLSQPLLLDVLDSPPRATALVDARGSFAPPELSLVASMQTINLYHRFFTLLPSLWTLWELVLLGEPLVVQADTPDVCSDAVLGLVSLVAPLTFGGDFRPFFNIHDPDFRAISDSTRDTRQGLVLGVTNPFFRKAFADWPHYVVLECVNGGEHHGGHDMAGGSISPTAGSGGGAKQAKQAKARKRVSAIHSSYKPLVLADKALAKTILADRTPTGESADRHNLRLRQHFLELTEAFVRPLERYFAQLMPLARAVSAFGVPPKLRSFSRSEFLASLSASPASAIGKLTKKEADSVELYSRFLGSPTFRAWYRARRAQANARVRELYLAEVFHADLPAWLHAHGEVDAVDLLMRYREQLVSYPADPDWLRARLREHVATILACLPSDVRTSLGRTYSASASELAAVAVAGADASESDAGFASPLAAARPPSPRARVLDAS